MDKILAFILISFLTLLPSYGNDALYKVIKIIDGDTVYIDFNNDGIAQKNEKVRINGIDTFETKPGEHLERQVQNFNLGRKQVLGMGYLAKEFAKKELLNKRVRAVYSAETRFDKNNRHLMSIYYDNKNYEKEVLARGLGVVYVKSGLAPELEKYRNQKKLERNFKKAEKLDLVYFDGKTKKYHRLDCKYASKYPFELVKKPLFNYKKADCCTIKTEYR